MLAGGRVSGACIVCGRTDRSSEQRLQADWSVERAALTGGLPSLACSAYTRTGRWKVPPRLQVDWPAQHTGACRRAGLATVQRCRRTGQSCLHRLRRPGRSCVQRLQADWSIDRSCSSCRRTGRSSVQRLQADWSIERAALAGGLVDRACSDFRRTSRSSVQRL